MSTYAPRLINGLVKAGAPTDGVNEVVTITIDATGGTFTITFGGQTTAALAWNASAAVVQAALEGLSSIGSGNITVGLAALVYTLTFSGSLSGKDVGNVTTSAAGLTGGGQTANVAVTTAGVNGSYRGAEPGQVMLDTTNHKIYQNTGTKYKVAWTELV